MALFLCSSDYRIVVSKQFGPTNYAACAGSGINGGSPIDTDGIFYVNSPTRMADLRDGVSNTALFSESVLGTPDGTTSKPTTMTDYKFTLTTPLTDSLCKGTMQWNVADGSVQFVFNEVDPLVWKAWSTRAGQEAMSSAP